MHVVFVKNINGDVILGVLGYEQDACKEMVKMDFSGLFGYSNISG